MPASLSRPASRASLQRGHACVKTRQTGTSAGSTLAGFEAFLGLVDDVNAALAANQTVVAVTLGQRFQRITNFHNDHHKGRRRLRMGAFDPPISGMPLL
jgi:hypothetical protein